MKMRYVLLIWLAIVGVMVGGSVWLLELGKEYGYVRVLNDMADFMPWLVGAGFGLTLIGIGILAVGFWREHRHRNDPEKPWVEQQ